MLTKTDLGHPFVLQKNRSHLQLISLCVAHRIKHLTMLLCVMLCRLRSIFGGTKLKKLFLPTVDNAGWMNWRSTQWDIHVVFLWRDLSVDSTKVKCWNLACEFACNSKICKKKQKTTFNISYIAIIFLPVFWHAVLIFAFIYLHSSLCLWWTVHF